MDTPTRERIEALEARVKELEEEIKALRQVAGAVSSGPDFQELGQTAKWRMQTADQIVVEGIAELKTEGGPIPESMK